MIRARASLLATALLVASPALAQGTYTSDKAHSEFNFEIRHLVSRVSGRFNDFTATLKLDPAAPDTSSVEVVIKATSIDTRIEDRDKHLRSADFFDVEKYPEITFKSTKIKSTGKDAYDVTGNFTMRGVTKEITLPVTFLGFIKDPRGNQRAGFSSETKLNRKEYGINWNRALDAGGFLLGDDVRVTVNMEAVEKKEPAPSPSAK